MLRKSLSRRLSSPVSKLRRSLRRSKSHSSNQKLFDARPVSVDCLAKLLNLVETSQVAKKLALYQLTHDVQSGSVKLSKGQTVALKKRIIDTSKIVIRDADQNELIVTSENLAAKPRSAWTLGDYSNFVIGSDGLEIGQGNSFVDIAERILDVAGGRPFEGRFVCYSPDTTFADFLALATKQAEQASHSTATFCLWIDFLSKVHQPSTNRSKSSCSWLTQELPSWIQQFQQVWIVSDTWFPEMFGTAEKLWEIYCATCRPDGKVDILLTPQAYSQFWDGDIFTGASLEKVSELEFLRSTFSSLENEDAASLEWSAMEVSAGVQTFLKTWLASQASKKLSLAERRKGSRSSVSRASLTPLEVSQLAYTCGVLYADLSQWDQAKTMLTRAVEVFEQIHETGMLVTCLLQLGKVESAMGNYDVAIELLDDLIASNEKDPAASSETLAHVFHEKAVAISKKGDVAGAIKWYVKSLEQWKKCNCKPAQLVPPLLNLALLCKKQRRLDDALKFYHQALTLQRRASAVQGVDQNVAFICEQLADVYSAQGDYEKAVEFYEQVLDTRRIDRGSDADALWLGEIKSKMGATFEKLEDLHKAIVCYEGALKALERSSEETLERQMRVKISLAGLKHKQGLLSAALDLYQQALSTLKSLHGEQHPNVAAILNNGAAILAEQGDVEQALQWYAQALSIRLAHADTDQNATATTLLNIGFLHEKLGNHSEALMHLEKALPLFRSGFGENHQMYKKCQSVVSHIHQQHQC